MSIIANWFPSVTQAREAMLDLLTSGVPREDISAIINAALDEQARAARIQSQVDGGEKGSHSFDFVKVLPGASTLTLQDIGSVVAAGPLADALISTGDGTPGGGLSSALVAVGVAEEQARMYAEQLRHGGALLAVQSDSSWDTIICGVFRHNADPALSEQEEPVGSTPASELAADEVGGPISTSIGALTGGMIPGGWGEASDVFEDQLEDTDGDDKRRHEPDA
jgi:hypothetical protein